MVAKSSRECLFAGSLKVDLGTLNVGDSVLLTWKATTTSSFPAANAGPSAITVTASGIITGSVPQIYGTDYPAYVYQDLIGGQASLSY